MITAASARCRNCQGPLQAQPFAGHYGRTLEIDVCGPCHLVWFDGIEQAGLSGPGLLELVGVMAQTQTLAHQGLKRDLGCLRCGGKLREVHNRTRWGPSRQLECVQRHGAWQTFAQFLGERGLLRVMSRLDRQRLLAQGGPLHCVACGGELAATGERCRWCEAEPMLVDVARLAQAADPEGATAGHRVHGTASTRTARHCAACGSAEGDEGGWSCTHCGATLVAPRLAEAHQQVQALLPALRAHAQKPVPAVVAERLRAQQAGLDRQRDRARALQAEADARQGQGRFGSDDLPPWAGGDGSGDDRLAGWLHRGGWVLGLLVLLLMWWFG